MKLNTIIKFKSIEEYYEKEKTGQKRNTVRSVTEEEDTYLQFILRDIKFIEISLLRSESEHFIRPLTDITRFEEWRGSICLCVLYIFSW